MVFLSVCLGRGIGCEFPCGRTCIVIKLALTHYSLILLFEQVHLNLIKGINARFLMLTICQDNLVKFIDYVIDNCCTAKYSVLSIVASLVHFGLLGCCVTKCWDVLCKFPYDVMLDLIALSQI